MTAPTVARGGGARPVAGSLIPPALTPEGQRWDRIAFTFCRMGTIGLIAWALTPPVFILLVSAGVVVLYGRAFALGVRRSRCFLRRPALIAGTWAAIGALDAVWLFALGQKLPPL
jgi:hypothetical protein